MREILFRGQTSEKEWVYGSHVYDYTYSAEYITKVGEHCKRVIPSTVGQYTGLTDKNGRRIFEGDIVRFELFNSPEIGKVVYNETTACFEFWFNVTVGAYGEKATHKSNPPLCGEIEIIGNIHYNPELLEDEFIRLNAENRLLRQRAEWFEKQLEAQS